MDVKQIWQKDVACSDDRDLNTRGEGEIPLTKSKQSETNVHHAGTVSEGHEYKGWDQESHTLKQQITYIYFNSLKFNKKSAFIHMILKIIASNMLLFQRQGWNDSYSEQQLISNNK